MRIPEHKIDEIRNTANIVDVIFPYVNLKKRGKNFIGLCPFHQEKTPSFTVSEEKQICHCFGCHAGGNVFKFLMEFKRISFVEAVKEVADKYGIAIDYEESSPSGAQTEHELLYDINVQAAKYFSENLLKSAEGEAARQYFTKRKIKSQSLKSFGLGYALNGWDNFSLYAASNKIDLEKAQKLGLIDLNTEGSYYDKFRGRVIFPILSPNGRVIAFGGRILEKTDKAAKYLNSPESIVYQKKYSLYGLYHSQDEIRRLDKALLVEGYMDVISLFQEGVKNVVASSGTSLTEEQAQLLSRYTKNITVVYDADDAGQKAAMRSIEILLKQDFDVKLLTLPDGEDPDSFILKFGKDDFDEQARQGLDVLEYQTARFKKMGMLEDPAKQTGAVRELVKTASFISDDLKRSLLIKNIAKKFNLREKLIETELNKFLNSNRNKYKRFSKLDRPAAPLTRMSVSDANSEKSFYTIEKDILKLLFSGSEKLVGFVFDNILPEELSHPDFVEIAKFIFSCYKDDVISPAAIVEKMEDERLKVLLLDLTVGEESISKRWDQLSTNGKLRINWEKQAADTVVKFRIKKIDEQIRVNNGKLTSAENEEEQIKLMLENKELKKEKKEILNNKSGYLIE